MGYSNTVSRTDRQPELHRCHDTTGHCISVCRLVRDSQTSSAYTSKRDREAGRIELSQRRYTEETLERYSKSNVRPIIDHRSARPRSRTSNSQNLHHPKSTSSRTNALLAPSCTPCSEPVRTSPTASEHSVCTRKARSHAWRRTLARPRSSVPLPLCDEGLGSWGLVYQCSAPEGLTLTGYIDADWENDLGDRKSTSGYV